MSENNKELIQAVLYTKGLHFSKHTSVIGSFNKNFVHEGIFPKELNNLITYLFDERMESDYKYDSSFQKEDAIENLETATKIVYLIKDYLKDQNFI